MLTALQPGWQRSAPGGHDDRLCQLIVLAVFVHLVFMYWYVVLLCACACLLTKTPCER